MILGWNIQEFETLSENNQKCIVSPIRSFTLFVRDDLDLVLELISKTNQKYKRVFSAAPFWKSSQNITIPKERLASENVWDQNIDKSPDKLLLLEISLKYIVLLLLDNSEHDQCLRLSSDYKWRLRRLVTRLIDHNEGYFHPGSRPIRQFDLCSVSF